MPEVGTAVSGKARERGRLPAGRKQQLPADRPVPTRQLHEGQRPIRRPPQDKAGGLGVGKQRRGRRAGAQSGPAGSGCACGGPPPCAACSFIFLIFSATVQALLEKPIVLA